MNESARSGAWRALEDHAEAAAGGPGSVSNDVPRTPGPAWVLVALAAAAVVAGIAIWVAVGGSHGTVLVEGGGPGPGRSGAGDELAIAGLPSPSAATLVIDVQGAVVRPGIVRLPAGSRIGDAIAAAGGYGPRVAADRIGQALNLAALVKDGDQVVVPSRDDPAVTPGSATSGGPGAGGPIDLNRATAAELDALPGIGPVTAAKIVAARAEQAFASVDELKTRKILGAATFDKVKDLVVVR